MADRLVGGVAVAVGVALVAVGVVEYVRPAAAPPPWDPLATGALVVATGLLLSLAGTLAAVAELDHLAVRAATGVGAGTLGLTIGYPDALLFGGVFWLPLVAAGLVTAGAYRTLSMVRRAE